MTLPISDPELGPLASHTKQSLIQQPSINRASNLANIPSLQVIYLILLLVRLLLIFV